MVNSMQTEIQVLLDRVADYKVSENVYLKKWKILQTLQQNSGDLEDGAIVKNYLATHPNFAREERETAVLDLENIDSLSEEGASDEPAETFNVPEVTLACQEACGKLRPILKQVMYWEHKIKSTKLLVERKKVAIEKLHKEIDAMESGA